MKFTISLILLMLLNTQCNSRSSAALPLFETSPELKISDLSYGSDPAQKLDLYLPEGHSAENTRIMVLIHGGGWNSGNKTDFNHYIDSFRRRMPELGFANINYRLYNGGNLFPVQEEDIRSAMNFLASKATAFGFREDSMILLGASAGAHLALLQAYKNPQPSVAAVIDFFGPTDLISMYNHPWHPMVTYALQTLTGTTPALNPSLYHDSSPLAFVSGKAPATLILHGDQDPVVDISQSKVLDKALTSAGVTHELIVYKGQRHGWGGNLLSNSFDRIEKFLSDYLR